MNITTNQFDDILFAIQNNTYFGPLLYDSELDLAFCRIDDMPINTQHIERLCSALRHNSIITKLSLRRCNIGDAEAKAIILGPPIISLNLRHNSIGDVGAKALSINLAIQRILLRLIYRITKLQMSEPTI